MRQLCHWFLGVVVLVCQPSYPFDPRMSIADLSDEAPDLVSFANQLASLVTEEIDSDFVVPVRATKKFNSKKQKLADALRAQRLAREQGLLVSPIEADEVVLQQEDAEPVQVLDPVETSASDEPAVKPSASPTALVATDGTTDQAAPDAFAPQEISMDAAETIESPEPAPGAPTGITMTLPLIGEVVLEPDPEGKGMVGHLADKKKKLELGALVLDDATLFLGSDGKLKLTARGTLLNKTVRVGMLEHTDKRTILGVTFDKPWGFHIVPGREVSLSSVEVKLEKDQPVAMRSKVTLLGKPVELFLHPTTESLKVTAKIPQLRLSDLITLAKGSPVDAVPLSKVSITVDHLLDKKEKPEAIITANADLSGVLHEAVSGSTAGVSTKIAIKSTGEATVNASLKDVAIPGFGSLDKAEFSADLVPKKAPQVKVSGTLGIDIPSAGKLPVILTAQVSEEGVKVSGEIEKGVSLYDGKVVIEKAKLSLNTKKETVSLKGDTMVFGHKAVARITKGPEEAKVDIALTEATMYPFEKVPGLKDVGFSDVHFKVGTHGASLVGTVHVLDGQMAGELEMDEKDGKEVYRLVASMPSLPTRLKGTFLEAAQPTDLYIALVSDEYLDPVKKMTYKAGINIGGKLNLSGPLEEIGNMTGEREAQEFLVVLPKNPLDLAVNIRIPKETAIAPNCKFKSLLFTISGGVSLQIALAGTLLFKPSEKDEEMTFVANGELVAVPTPGFKIEASYQGQWVNALGIKGFTLQKLGFGLGAQIVPPPSLPIVPSMIAFAGAMILAGREIEVSMKGDLVKEKYGAYGKLKPTQEEIKAGHTAALRLEDLVTFAADLAKKKIDTSAIPRLELQNFELRAAPEAYDIAGLHYDAGMLFKTEFNLLGVQAHVDFETMDFGLKGLGYLDKFVSGPFSMVGTGTTGGPALDIEISPMNPHLIINGDIRLGDVIRSYGNLEISSKQIALETEQKFKLEDTQLRLFIKGLAPFKNAPPDLYLKATFENTIYDWVYKKMKAPLDAAAQDADRRFNDALAKVDDLGKEIERTNKDIDVRKRQIKERQDWINSL